MSQSSHKHRHCKHYTDPCGPASAPGWGKGHLRPEGLDSLSRPVLPDLRGSARSAARGEAVFRPKPGPRDAKRSAYALSIWTELMTMSFTGRSLRPVGVFPIFWTMSIPSTTSPKIACLLSSQGVGTRVTKNWLPLV